MSESRIRLDPDERDRIDSAVKRTLQKKKRQTAFGDPSAPRRHSKSHIARIVTRWLRIVHGRSPDAPELTVNTVTNSMERIGKVERRRKGPNKVKKH